MPEGPEVHTITDQLNDKVKGFYVLSINHNEKSQYYGKRDSSIRTALYVEAVKCKGKNIFFHTKSGNNKVYIHCHLRMEGKFSEEKGNYSHNWFTIGTIIPFGSTLGRVKKFDLYFDDSRKFGVIDFLDENQYQEKLNTVGPDLLTDKITTSEWRKEIAGRRMNICSFLMNQEIFSGIGNYLKAEILYATKISPHRSLNQLSEKEIDNLLIESKRIIKESYHSNGFTIKTYSDVRHQKGKFKCKVYNKKVDPLGNEIRTEKTKDGRTTHWVQNIQM